MLTRGDTHPPRHAIPHAFRVRLQQLPSPMLDTCLRLLPFFKNIFALIAPTLYMLSLSKNCLNLNFHCPIFSICQSHAIVLLPGWQVWPSQAFQLCTDVYNFISSSVCNADAVYQMVCAKLITNRVNKAHSKWLKLSSCVHSFRCNCYMTLNSFTWYNQYMKLKSSTWWNKLYPKDNVSV